MPVRLCPPFYGSRSDGRLRYETHISKEMRYKGATPSGNFLDDYETSRAYAVEFLRACDGTAKVRPESRDKRKRATSANDKDDSGRKPTMVLLFELKRIPIILKHSLHA